MLDFKAEIHQIQYPLRICQYPVREAYNTPQTS